MDIIKKATMEVQNPVSNNGSRELWNNKNRIIPRT